MDVGNKNLQQCADAIIRLRAEYLFGNGNLEAIHFNFTNGDTAYYILFRDGYRPELFENNTSWIKKDNPDSSYLNFRKYLDLVFTYAGTYSLYKELKPIINCNDIQIGDIFIQTGNPYGHAVIIVDMAKNHVSEEKIFLLAQSFMPAQDMHILNNPSNNLLSPWYLLDSTIQLVTPEWVFNYKDLKRFKEE